MRYHILLFDIDDTLLDFGANETDSLNQLFQEYGYVFSEELFRLYNSVNKQLWADYENGKIALSEVLNTRFCYRGFTEYRYQRRAFVRDRYLLGQQQVTERVRRYSEHLHGCGFNGTIRHLHP